MKQDKQSALVVLGTRPEAIKLAPVILAMQADPRFTVHSCSTGQHRDMLRPVSDLFGFALDFDLRVMTTGQSIDQVTTAILTRLPVVLESLQPDLVVVQGDTSTAFSAALSAFQHQIPVAHIEAGLRTFDIRSPWPEEGFRAMIGRLADFHFAPTERALENLLRENVPGAVSVTGNTVVDAAQIALSRIQGARELQLALQLGLRDGRRKKMLFTMHRRESWGQPLEDILHAVDLIAANGDVDVIFPVHPNPAVRDPANRILGQNPNVRLLEPLAYDELVCTLKHCSFVVTDSGGLAEEAPTFGKPALILRDETERPECVECGNALLIGRDPRRLESLVFELLAEGELFKRMSGATNPFGDGKAAERILDHLADSRAQRLAAA